MKKFLIATTASLLIFAGQAEASTVESLDKPIEIQDMGKWAHFRDKHILGRETENERRDRKEWERRHRDDRRRYHDDYRYNPPPPPPRYREGRRYYPPAPPRYGSSDRNRYVPPQPPTRYR